MGDILFFKWNELLHLCNWKFKGRSCKFAPQLTEKLFSFAVTPSQWWWRAGWRREALRTKKTGPTVDGFRRERGSHSDWRFFFFFFSLLGMWREMEEWMWRSPFPWRHLPAPFWPRRKLADSLNDKLSRGVRAWASSNKSGPPLAISRAWICCFFNFSFFFSGYIFEVQKKNWKPYYFE